MPSKHLIRGVVGLLLSGSLFCTAFLLIAQDGLKPQGELEELRREIRESEVRLQSLEKQAKQSATAAAESRKQSRALDSLITLLEVREGKIARQMISLRTVRDSLEGEQQRRKEEYVRVARTLYKRHLLTPSASMLLMPEEHRKLALAEVLFNRYGERQRHIAAEIRDLTDSLNQRDSQLDRRRAEQLKLLREQRLEATKLHQLERKYSTALQQTEESKGKVERLLREKQREARQLEDLIRRVAAKGKEQAVRKQTKESKSKEKRSESTQKQATSNEKKKQSEEKPKATQKEKQSQEPVAKERDESVDNSGPFRPTWPVASRNILEGYGERKNEKTNTVTFNPGINISASSGTPVVASASGRVSLVSWMAGYGTIVIIEHTNGWRTVYANLASASLSEGKVVKKGERIGTVGESIDGSYLHFQMWQGGDRKNPVHYLR